MRNALFDINQAAGQIEVIANRIEENRAGLLDYVALMHVFSGIVLQINEPKTIGAGTAGQETLDAEAKLRAIYKATTGNSVPSGALGDGTLLRILFPLVVKALIPLLLASHPELAPLIPALQELIDSIINR